MLNNATATIEVDDDAAEGYPRRVVLITVAVLLPPDFEDADIADIRPTTISVEGYADAALTDFIQTSVQEARLVMT